MRSVNWHSLQFSSLSDSRPFRRVWLKMESCAEAIAIARDYGRIERQLIEKSNEICREAE